MSATQESTRVESGPENALRIVTPIRIVFGSVMRSTPRRIAMLGLAAVTLFALFWFGKAFASLGSQAGQLVATGVAWPVIVLALVGLIIPVLFVLTAFLYAKGTTVATADRSGVAVSITLGATTLLGPTRAEWANVKAVLNSPEGLTGTVGVDATPGGRLLLAHGLDYATSRSVVERLTQLRNAASP